MNSDINTPKTEWLAEGWIAPYIKDGKPIVPPCIPAPWDSLNYAQQQVVLWYIKNAMTSEKIAFAWHIIAIEYCKSSKLISLYKTDEIFDKYVNSKINTIFVE